MAQNQTTSQGRAPASANSVHLEDSSQHSAALPLGQYLDVPVAALEAVMSRQRENQRQAIVAAPADQPHSLTRIGQLLVAEKIITEAQLQAALRRQRIDRLAACGLLAGATIEQLAPLADMVYEVSVDKGRTFIEQGAAGDCFFIVASGTIQVFGSHDGADETALATLGPGQTIGEMGYFTDGRRTASARAMEPSELLALYYRDLPACFEAVPYLATGFMRSLTRRLSEMNQQYDVTVNRARATEQSLKHLGEYLDLSDHLTLGMGIEALIERVVRSASKLLGADRASLFLVEPATGELWSKVAQGAEIREIRVRKGYGFVGWAAQHGRTLNVAEAYNDDRFDPATDQRTGYRTRTVLCGPVHNLAGEVIGVIQVINKWSGQFGPLDEQLFKAFANQAAIAVENFNLYRRLASSHEKMAIMLDVATSVTQTLDLPSLIRKIVAKVAQILQCDRSSFFVLDRETNELWSMEAHGSDLKEIRFPSSAGLAGHTARTGEVVNIADAYDDVRFNQAFDKATGYRTQTVLCVPTLDRDGNTMGVTQAINKNGGPFTEDDVALLKAISSQIGVAVENAQLYARTASMKNYLQSVQESISNSILTLDEQYRVVTANKAALALLEAEPGQCLKRDLREVLGSTSSYLLKLVDKVYTANAGAVAMDVEVSAEGKKSSTVNANVLPLSGPDQARQGLVVVLEDITREKRIKSLLIKKMAKDVVERLLADPQMQKLGGKRGKATILFSDIREFTSISESMTAEEVVEMLNGYFTVMVEQVQRYDGVLDKFIGDAIMALFGVPFPEADDAIRAVRTAVRMRDALRSFNAARAGRGLPPLLIGIGVNTGEVVYGNIGAESRSDFTVIGDTVNLASRLEGLNKHYGTQILITDLTRQDLGDQFVLRPVDLVRVKGKAEPTEVYEVLGEAGHQMTAAQTAFGQGLKSYRQRAFQEALGQFRSGGEGDAPCRLFASRCEQMIAEPPPPGWDGVWDLESK